MNNLFNMANLVTNHDPYHVHKLFGLASLFNWLLRLYYLFTYGTAFPNGEPLYVAVCCVLLHGLLSISSMLLPLPSKRNFSSPMIWPEFRLHSITFAMRHVIGTIFSLSGISFTYKHTEAFVKLGLIILTNQCSARITDKYGDRENRTTNSMPYPTCITQDMQKRIKNMYAGAQIGATKLIVLQDPTLNYIPLLGIQMAPLLMTLVRKGKISSINYHRTFALSLLMGYVALFVRLCMQPDTSLIVHLLMSNLFPLLRLRRNGMSPGILWAYYVMFQMTLTPVIEEFFGMPTVMLACAVTALIFDVDDSEVPFKFQALWMLLLVLGLVAKRTYISDPLLFKEKYVEQYIAKFAYLILLPLILEQIQGYKCLFFAKTE